MASNAEAERSSSLMRALSRATNSPKVRQIVKTVIATSSDEASEPQASKSAADMAETQQSLKEHVAGHPDGVELWPLPGLAPMTRVRTNFGDVHAIALRKGDKVLLKSGDYKPITWINRIMLDEHILNLKPDSNPVVLAAGSLASGMPAQEIMVSPRQVFCADDLSGLANPREAATLLSRNGIRRLKETGLTYTMFHVGESADVYCEGLFLRFPIEP